MNFDLNDNKEVVVLLGAGDMGLAIIKRFSAGKKILLADINEEKLVSLKKELTYQDMTLKLKSQMQWIWNQSRHWLKRQLQWVL